MITLIFALSTLTCPDTIMIGFPTPDSMTWNDVEIYSQAVKECPKRYPNSPCLVRFELVSFQNYKITCGRTLDEK